MFISASTLGALYSLLVTAMMTQRYTWPTGKNIIHLGGIVLLTRFRNPQAQWTEVSD